MTTLIDKVWRYREIAVVYNVKAADQLKRLTAEERIFIYYLFRAILAGNLIATDQLHRHGIEVLKIFEFILKHSKNDFSSLSLSFNLAEFFEQIEIFLVYLWSSHGQYFARENENEKRTPTSIGLNLLTKDNIISILNHLAYPKAKETIDALQNVIFDKLFEPTVTVPDNINKSAVNLYSEDFTDQDFENLTLEQKTKLNAYFYVDVASGFRIPKMIAYALDAKYSMELEVINYWLEKALDHADKYPNLFDEHLRISIKHLINFFENGDEEFFKKHSTQWLKSNSNVDYTIGFIETYKDPKSSRGLFQADITIKTFKLTELNAALPDIEAKLPFPKEFMRDGILSGTATLPNASINRVISASGELGPMGVTAAYCLPNYEDIRSSVGSKQIIYESDRGLGEIFNPVLSIKLNNLAAEAEWILKNDPQNQLSKDLWNIQCILHETIGHASGKLAEHIFREGEKLEIDGKKFNVGDKLPLSNKHLSEFLAGYEQTIEELRAEIIALYVSINFIDELEKIGLFENWLEKLGKKDLIKFLILNMVDSALRRLTQQNDNATEISGDHARANQTIMNFLADGRGLSIQEEVIVDKGEHLVVLGCKINNLDLVISGIEELAVLVQSIKSTADGISAKNLIETHGCKINKKHFEIMRRNKKLLVGDLKATSYIYPNLVPAYDEQTGIISDIHISWPKNFIEQQMLFSELALSKNA